jgi:hypothetical protein
MFSNVMLILAVVIFLLAAFGIAALAGMSTIPLGLALGFGATLAARFGA